MVKKRYALPSAEWLAAEWEQFIATSGDTEPYEGGNEYFDEDFD